MKLDIVSTSLLLFITLALLHAATASKKHYIVYMGEHSHPNSDSVINANHEIIASVTQSLDEAKNVAVHRYTRSFRGFSAMLTEQQAHRLAGIL